MAIVDWTAPAGADCGKGGGVVAVWFAVDGVFAAAVVGLFVVGIDRAWWNEAVAWQTRARSTREAGRRAIVRVRGERQRAARKRGARPPPRPVGEVAWTPTARVHRHLRSPRRCRVAGPRRPGRGRRRPRHGQSGRTFAAVGSLGRSRGHAGQSVGRSLTHAKRRRTPSHSRSAET